MPMVTMSLLVRRRVSSSLKHHGTPPSMQSPPDRQNMAHGSLPLLGLLHLSVLGWPIAQFPRGKMLLTPEFHGYLGSSLFSFLWFPGKFNVQDIARV